MSTVINGSTGINKVQDGSIQPEDLAQKMTLMTAQTASGTFVDFTGIPSWAKRITVMFSGVSTSGASLIIIQVGSGTVTTTGYSGYAAGGNSGVAVVSSTQGFPLRNLNGSASEFLSGAFDILIPDANKILFRGVDMTSLPAFGVCAGDITLSGTLDRVRITTVNGTDTFDAGTINIMYEG